MFLAGENGVRNDKYPSQKLADFVDDCFAILDYVYQFIQKKKIIDVREICTAILSRYAPKANFTCDEHVDWGFKFASRSVINCFFNNMEDIDNDKIRKDGVAAFKKSKRQKRD